MEIAIVVIFMILVVRMVHHMYVVQCEQQKNYYELTKYYELKKSPQNYIDKKIKFSGEVIEITEEENDLIIRFKIRDGVNYKKEIHEVILCISKDNINQKINKSERYSIKGIGKGTIKRGKKAMPYIVVDKIK